MLGVGVGVTSIMHYLPAGTDPDAGTYLAAVEAADAQPLEPGVRAAVGALVAGLKDDGLWDAITASCLLAGPRTLAGALVPLKGPAPTNVNFVGGDYARKSGLIGNGTNKHIESGFAYTAAHQDDAHMAIWISEPSTAGVAFAGNVAFGGGAQLGYFTSGTEPNSFYRLHNGPTVIGGMLPGFHATSRASLSGMSFRRDGASDVAQTSAQAVVTAQVTVFARAATNHVNGRIPFYSLGRALDLAAFEARVAAYLGAIDAAIA